MRYNWDAMTDAQKIKCIDHELSLYTHMGVTKDDLINMIRYMRDQFEVEETEESEPEPKPTWRLDVDANGRTIATGKPGTSGGGICR